MPTVQYVHSRLGDYVVPVAVDGNSFGDLVKQIRLSGGAPADLGFIFRGIGVWDEFVQWAQELERMDQNGQRIRCDRNVVDRLSTPKYHQCWRGAKDGGFCNPAY